MKKTKSLAFTLAEVLITLGVIGVVCAMTIPTLMKNTQDAEFKTAYKKAFAVASQAMTSLYNDYEYHPYSEGNYNFDLFKSKFNVAKDCSSGNNSSCWVPTGEKACDGTCGGPGLPISTCHAFIDNSGMAWTVYYDLESIILVDTNGNKAPNKYGKDRWLLNYGAAISTGKLLPVPDDPVENDFTCHYPPCYSTSWLYN